MCCERSFEWYLDLILNWNTLGYVRCKGGGFQGDNSTVYSNCAGV